MQWIITAFSPDKISEYKIVYNVKKKQQYVSSFVQNFNVIFHHTPKKV